MHPVPTRDGLAYGLLGLPLAFAALPLYVHWPAHYAATLGVSLAPLGLLLLAVRAIDAVVDPWLGGLAARSVAAGRAVSSVSGAAVFLVLGLAALFLPPVLDAGPALAWAAVALLVTTLAYSVATLLHLAWGARLPGGPIAQPAWMGWREGAGLFGVMAASVLPAVVRWPTVIAILAVLLFGACFALARAPQPTGPAQPDSDPSTQVPAASTWAPWREPRWRGLLAVHVLNGIANALPATLLLFFVRDHLQTSAFEPAYLGTYFLAAALTLPLWVRLARRRGTVQVWLASMGLAVLTFAGASALGPGDSWGFLLVCAATGTALGADLMAPPALLATWLRERTPAGDAGVAASFDGAAFGWWTAAGKFTLALAAGLALPALDAAGYRPGGTAPGGVPALVVAYCLVPCLLKLLALASLCRWARTAPPAGPRALQSSVHPENAHAPIARP